MSQEGKTGEESWQSELQRTQEQLGFVETPELAAARQAFAEAVKTKQPWNTIKALLDEFQRLGEAIVEQKPNQGDEFSRAQIGLIIATGLAWEAGGKLDSAGAEFWNAQNYSRNKGYADVVQTLEAAIEETEKPLAESEAMSYVGPPTEELVAVCKREFPTELEELDYLLPLPPEEALEQIAALMIERDVAEKPEDFFSRMGWIGQSQID